MTLGKGFVATVAVLVVAGSLVVAARAHEKESVEAALEHYFPIRAALASDTLEGVEKNAKELAESGNEAVADAAEAIAKARALAEARASFGDLSKALFAEGEAAKEKGTKLPALFFFECPIAKPYGKWLQEKDEIGNPYFGKSMLRCGSKVGSTGVAAPKIPAEPKAAAGPETPAAPAGGGCCPGCGGE